MYYRLANLLFLKAITPIHVGSGRGYGEVDLPIQKDSLGFPMIPSSSLKGSFKSHIWRSLSDGEKLAKIFFGPEPETAEEHFVGSVAILDARLLYIPARSLKGLYCYITTPKLLESFNRLLEVARSLGCDIKGFEEFDRLLQLSRALKEDEALTTLGGIEKLTLPLKEGTRGLVINEDFEFNAKQSEELLGFAQWLIGNKDEGDRLVVIPDHYSREVVSKSLLRRMRIRLLRGSKTVKPGGLWSEEDVPADSCFYTLILYSRVALPEVEEGRHMELREKYGSWEVEDVKQAFEERVVKKLGYLILGGHETVGRGIVRLELMGG